MAEYVTTNIRLPKAMHAALKRRALDENKSIAALIRESVAEHLLSDTTSGQRLSPNDTFFLLGVDDAVDMGSSDLAEQADEYLYGAVDREPGSDQDR